MRYERQRTCLMHAQKRQLCRPKGGVVPLTGWWGEGTSEEWTVYRGTRHNAEQPRVIVSSVVGQSVAVKSNTPDPMQHTGSDEGVKAGQDLVGHK